LAEDAAAPAVELAMAARRWRSGGRCSSCLTLDEKATYIAATDLDAAPHAAKKDSQRIPPWVLALVAWAVLREVQVAIASGGFGNDVMEYFGYARGWAEGRAPYVDFNVEYPPGALILFLVPLLVGGRARYIKSFVGEMAVFDLLALLLVMALARRIAPESRRRPAIAAAVYLASTALLHPVLYARFDLAPATLLLAAIFLARPGRPWSPFLLGLAGAVKLWPLGLAPLWLGSEYRRAGSKRLLRAAAWIGAGYIAPALLLLPRVGGRVTAFLQFHVQRGVQIESLWGTLALALDRVGLGSAKPLFEFGAWDVQCPACPAFATVSVPLLVVAVAVPQVLALRRGAWSDQDAGGRMAMATCAAAVLGALVTARVLSPQYLLWTCGLIAIAGWGWTRAGLVAAAALTTVIYPVLYPAFIDTRAENHGLALAFALARNLILLAMYVAFVRLLARAADGQHRVGA